MPDPDLPDRKRTRKPEKFFQDSLPETGVPPEAAARPRRRRHSFYARFFTRLELKDLEQLDANKLSDEIAIIRVGIRRCFEAASSNESTDLESWVSALAALGLAASRLGNLLRIQKALSLGGEDEFMAMVSKALTQVTKELKL